MKMKKKMMSTTPKKKISTASKPKPVSVVPVEPTKSLDGKDAKSETTPKPIVPYTRKHKLARAIRDLARAFKSPKKALVAVKLKFPDYFDGADFIPAMERFARSMEKHGDGAIVSLDISEAGAPEVNCLMPTPLTGKKIAATWVDDVTGEMDDQRVEFVKGQPFPWAQKWTWPLKVKPGAKPVTPETVPTEKHYFKKAVNKHVLRCFKPCGLRPHERIVATGKMREVYTKATEWATASDKPLSADALAAMAAAMSPGASNRICKCGCGQKIPLARGATATYVNDAHSLRAKNERRRKGPAKKPHPKG